MKLADSSHRKLEAFFREYLNDKEFKLPEIYFYAGYFTGVLTKLISVHGITFGRRIFILPGLVSQNRSNQPQLSAELAAHEIAHVLQYEREGFGRFLYKYLADYRKNLRRLERRDAFARQTAYLEIPFEIEARRIAAEFIVWKENSDKILIS